MFEAKITPAGAASVQESAELRAFDWCELTARLAASRDLRMLVQRRSGAAGASFDRSAATCLASQGNGIRAVNPNDLGHGKSPWGKKPEVASDAANGDREK